MYLFISIMVMIILIAIFIISFILYNKTPSPIKQEKCENCPLKDCLNQYKKEENNK